MGNFYTSITLKDVPLDAVVREMRALNREAYVFSDRHVVVVYDRETEKQDTSVLAALAEHLATKLKTIAFAVLDHDDDALWFQLYDGNDLVAEYCNQKGPRTNIGALAAKLTAGRFRVRLWYLLHRPYVTQIYRHIGLNKLFGFPEANILGYEYVHRGERTDDMPHGELVRIPGSLS
jgi:hypothetical protein